MNWENAIARVKGRRGSRVISYIKEEPKGGLFLVAVARHFEAIECPTDKDTLAREEENIVSMRYTHNAALR